ncbi:SemiSWEET transporter [Marinomonas mediterranea]|uniref:SemiSWEET transporter n=1 Tax=Marinomonas mediterranea TaxID=119864 RepID=UPI00234B8CF8|nr:SemiSWEET transporter [Marinomonas mediterranea]WCN11241.1 hypothetical protein GV055_21050 [Marinomonas mediterranea]
MDTMTIIGLLAAFSTTFSFVPQVWAIIKTRNIDGISLSMYTVFTSGVFMWLVYGILAKDMPIIIANAITFSLAFTVLCLTIRLKRKLERNTASDDMSGVSLAQ